MRWQFSWLIIAWCTTFVLLGAPVSGWAQGAGETSAASRLLKAQAGDSQEQFLLGVMYEGGNGVAQDFTQAAHWYRQAAEHGHTRAELSLGSLYDRGQGVEQSYEKAAKWYSKAAIAGDGEAMFFLGSMYYNGDGLKSDLAASLVWFQGAAEKQYPLAEQALAKVKVELAQNREAQNRTGSTITPAAALRPKAVNSQKQAAMAAANTDPLQSITPVKKGYVVQIGSFQSREKAKKFLDYIQTKAAGLIQPSLARIYKKTFASGRVFYRLNVNHYNQRSEANQQCVQLKSRDIDCIVVKY